MKDLVDQICEKKTKGPFDFDYSKLDTHEGRKKLKQELHKLGLKGMGITKFLMRVDY